MNDTSPLQIFNESGLAIPVQEETALRILHSVSDKEKAVFSFVELVYVDEQAIMDINKQFLSRDYVTDIISFRYDDDDSNQEIEGTLYCCAPRISEQAREFDVAPVQEFYRIYIHGLLHLVGYDDQSRSEKAEMTKLENQYLTEAGLI